MWVKLQNRFELLNLDTVKRIVITSKTIKEGNWDNPADVTTYTVLALPLQGNAVNLFEGTLTECGAYLEDLYNSLTGKVKLIPGG